jgi:hypothetical protein
VGPGAAKYQGLHRSRQLRSCLDGSHLLLLLWLVLHFKLNIKGYKN